MTVLTERGVVAARLGAQGLVGGVATAAEAVARSGGVQAQDVRSERLSVRARTVGHEVVLGDVRRACDAERAVARTWLMRGTLHAVPMGDLRWLTALFGPLLVRRDARRRGELGLDDGLCTRALDAMREVMAGQGPVRRQEVIDRIAECGVVVDPEGQARIHLLAYAAGRGVICRGPETDADEHTFVLLDEWAPEPTGAEPVGQEQAATELARRHLTAFGPVGEGDFAYWSKLPAALVRAGLAGIAGETAEVATESGPMPVHRDRMEDVVAAARSAMRGGAGPVVRLAARWDSYLLGYRPEQRSMVVDEAHLKRVFPGSGVIEAAVLVDGRAVGVWGVVRKGASAHTATIRPFEEPERWDAAVRRGVEEELAGLERFLGTRLAVEFAAAGG